MIKRGTLKLKGVRQNQFQTFLNFNIITIGHKKSFNFRSVWREQKIDCLQDINNKNKTKSRLLVSVYCRHILRYIFWITIHTMKICSTPVILSFRIFVTLGQHFDRAQHHFSNISCRITKLSLTKIVSGMRAPLVSMKCYLSQKRESKKKITIQFAKVKHCRFEWIFRVHKKRIHVKQRWYNFPFVFRSCDFQWTYCSTKPRKTP